MKILLTVLFFCLIVPASAGSIWIGIEDIPLPGGDRDYNDSVFSLTGTSLSVVGAGSWQPMVVPNTSGTPYWNNSSFDGGDGWNIGYFMTGTGVYGANPYSPAISVSNLEYWGVGTSADNSVLLFSNGNTSSQLLLEVAAWSDQTNVYWFEQNSPNTLNLLFGGSAMPGAFAEFSPNGNFGLLLQNPDSTFDSLANGNQFALFRQTEPIPEPATMALMSLGLLGLGVIRHKRASRRS